MTIKKTLDLKTQQGQEAPRGYGLAYVDYIKGIAVLYPMPLNFLIMLARFVWQYLKNPNIQDVFNQGYEAGFTLGYENGIQQGEQAFRDLLATVSKSKSKTNEKIN